jgi:antirestriction protein ArdC
MGINVLILWSARDEHGYPSPQWIPGGARQGRIRAEWRECAAVIFAKKMTFNEKDDNERKDL